MVKQGVHEFNGKRVLLLQGPVGPFFRRLSRDLTLAGARVFKVNFNAGDWLYYPSDAINFRGPMDSWPAYLEELLGSMNIDVVLLFGDCRPLHHSAIKIAMRCGLEVGVFEEGYVRPNYVTFERFGVNGHSRIPRTAGFYMRGQKQIAEPPMTVGNTYWHMVLWVCLYYLAAILLKPLFPHYAHHRPLTVWEVGRWLRSVWRKWHFTVKEYGMAARFTGEFSKRFFLVPLQVHNDAQIHIHSGYDSVSHFISDVVASFAACAPRHTVLVIKHHPMDRAYFDYTRLIRELVVKHSLQDRCFYIHDQHLPPLLKHACGVVVVNSTVGMSALYHGAPVKACGKAIYDMPGLTFQGSLALFWRKANQSIPNRELYQRYLNYLIRHTQLNGSFYRRLPVSFMSAGLRWAEYGVPTASSGARTAQENLRHHGKILASLAVLFRHWH